MEQPTSAHASEPNGAASPAQASKDSSRSPGLGSVQSQEESMAGNLAGSKGSTKATSTTNSSSADQRLNQEKPTSQGMSKMHKFQLYETTSRFFLVGMDVMDKNYRILKIDRTVESGDLSLAKDDIVYTKKEVNQLLSAIDEGNKASGGIKLRCSAWGLLGFIRFTVDYYMLLVTKRVQIAMVGGHYIYQIDGTELIPLTHATSNRFKLNQHPEETRYVSILSNLDLSRSFYFSYSYDITRTLQCNLIRARTVQKDGTDAQTLNSSYNEMFVWNRHLLEPADVALKGTSDWCLPIVHGFIDQASEWESSP